MDKQGPFGSKTETKFGRFHAQQGPFGANRVLLFRKLDMEKNAFHAKVRKNDVQKDPLRSKRSPKGPCFPEGRDR